MAWGIPSPAHALRFGAVQLSPDTENIPHNINGRYQPGTYADRAGHRACRQHHRRFQSHSPQRYRPLRPWRCDDNAHYRRTRISPRRPPTNTSKATVRLTATTPRWHAPVIMPYTSIDYGIDAEFTATPRCGVHRYTYQPRHRLQVISYSIWTNTASTITIRKSLWTYTRVESPTLITGYRIANGWARTNYTYFAIELSVARGVTDYGYNDRQTPAYNGFWRRFNLEHNFPEIAGRKIVAYFDVNVPQNRRIELRVALSGAAALRAR